jgi:hypothetical protein
VGVGGDRGADVVAEQDLARRGALGEPPGGGDRRSGRGGGAARSAAEEDLAGLHAEAQLRARRPQLDRGAGRAQGIVAV